MAATARTNQPMGGDRIVSDPKVHGGKLTVRDTSVPVERILAQLTANPDIDAVLVRHPNLTSEDIKAVMEYARAAVEAVTDRSTVQDIWANYDPEKYCPYSKHYARPHAEWTSTSSMQIFERHEGIRAK